jgi:hypothetical protein
VIVADIDTDDVAKVRGRIPSLMHDRPFSRPHGVEAIRGAAE